MSTRPPTQHLWADGVLKGVTITFPDEGSELPAHSHEVGAAHFTFVRKGRLEITRPSGVSIVEPGTWLKFDPGEIHSYKALIAGSKITNIIY